MNTPHPQLLLAAELLFGIAQHRFHLRTDVNRAPLELRGPRHIRCIRKNPAKSLLVALQHLPGLHVLTIDRMRLEVESYRRNQPRVLSSSPPLAPCTKVIARYTDSLNHSSRCSEEHLGGIAPCL